MARIYKIEAYIVDPNGCYGDASDWFDQMMNDERDVYCPVKPKCKTVEFEWDDSLPINYYTCKEEDCKKYFEEV